MEGFKAEDLPMKDEHSERNHNQYSIRVARSLEEVEELRSIWEGWQWHPNADIDFYLTIVNSRKEILRPHVILLLSNNQPMAMMIGRMEEIRLDFKVGYKTLFKPKARILNFVYGGILGEQSNSNAEIIIDELINSLKRGEADAVFLSHLPLDSNIYQVARRKPGFLYRDPIPIVNLHWQITLPASVDAFFQKMDRKRRHEINRIIRKFEKEKRVIIKCYRQKEETEQLCNDAEEIAKKSYLRGLTAGFVHNYENQRRVTLEANRGRLLAYILYVGDKPCAFYGKTFHLDFTAYDPIYHKYEPGTVLLIKIIGELCKNENGNINYIDFGLGDAFYKRRLCDRSWKEASMYLFAPTLNGITINSIRIILGTISRSTESFLKQTKFLATIKRHWRKYLRRKVRNDNGKIQ
jgi:hypothetical protein